MNRRVIAALAAAILAIVGGVLLTLYVQGADNRALAGQQPVSVLVVTKPILKGTSVIQARDSMAVREVPGVAIVTGAVDAIGDLEPEYVAVTDLQVGEQVLPTRFADPVSEEVTESVQVPKGMEQVSILLDPQRVIGSRLRAGETVGVIASFEIEDPETEKGIETTHLMLSRVLVTRVQGVTATTSTNGTATAEEAPSNQVMVTLAVSAHDAERVVFAQEFGTIWLTRQGATSDQGDARITTAGNIYR